MQHALEHAGVAALIAPLVGIFLAAMIDWAARRQSDAIVNEIGFRFLEGIVGGALEGLLVSLVILGLSLSQ